jgi:protein-tyrosine phosphatase
LIDIHSHVLYGMDDGAQTLEDSLAMLKMAAETGTTDIVATPHASPDYQFEPDLIWERLQQLREAAPLPIRIYTGCDFHLTYDNINDAITNPRKYTINQNRYLLVEFSDLMIFKNTDEIFSLLQDAGMVPVITHPERNPLLRQRIQEMAAWVDGGALIQVTGQSLMGHFGKKAQDFSRTLMDYRMVHFIASDGHNLKFRPPRMDDAMQWIRKEYGEAMAEALCVRNPQATLTGEEIEMPEPPVAAQRKWFEFWR